MRTALPRPGNAAAATPSTIAAQGGEKPVYSGGPVSQLPPPVSGDGVTKDVVFQSHPVTSGGGDPVATVVDEAEFVASPKPKRFEVLNDCTIGLPGRRLTVKAGKIMDELNYDIPKIKSQGVKLREVQE